MWLLLLVCFLGALAVSFGIWALLYLVFGGAPASAAMFHHGAPYTTPQLHDGGGSALFGRRRSSSHHSDPDQYVLFLEHLVASLLRNVTHPGSFVREQERYWQASRDLEAQLQQLMLRAADLAAQVKVARLALDDIEQLVKRTSDDPQEKPEFQLDDQLRDYFEERMEAMKKATASGGPAGQDSKPALSAQIRSSPWYMYMMYLVGSVVVAAAIAIGILKITGVALPFKVPFLSDFLN